MNTESASRFSMPEPPISSRTIIRFFLLSALAIQPSLRVSTLFFRSCTRSDVSLAHLSVRRRGRRRGETVVAILSVYISIHTSHSLSQFYRFVYLLPFPSDSELVVLFSLNFFFFCFFNFIPFCCNPPLSLRVCDASRCPGPFFFRAVHARAALSARSFGSLPPSESVSIFFLFFLGGYRRLRILEYLEDRCRSRSATRLYPGGLVEKNAGSSVRRGDCRANDGQGFADFS